MNTDYSEYELSPREKRRFFAAAYFCIFFMCMLFYNNVFFSLACGFGAVFFEREYAAHLAARRRRELSLQFRDLLYSLSASIAAGRQMGEALSEAYENLGLVYDEHTPMMEELHAFDLGIRENHISEESFLMSLAERSGIEDIRNFVDVYVTCRETGADLEEVIENSTEVLMDKIDIEREIQALTAQKQFEGRVITVLPLGVIFCLDLFSPDYLEAMYSTIAGRVVMTACMGGIVAAYILTERLLRIEV
jgi:tight adherence protein B